MEPLNTDLSIEECETFYLGAPASLKEPTSLSLNLTSPSGESLVIRLELELLLSLPLCQKV